ncbi:MAG: hypothetical protein ACRCT8_06010 [Lacipirellulaceae bacterium]
MKLPLWPALAAAALLATTASAQVLFTETFDSSASASRFNVTRFSLNTTGDPPVEASASTYSEFGFDYTATGTSRLTADITTSVTGAPSAGGSERGLLLAANLGPTANRSSINLYPVLSGMGLPLDPVTNLPVIDGNYSMTFDFFGGVNGTGDLQTGGAGTTEYLMIGAQSNGDGRHMNGFGTAQPDSDFLEVNINGDLLGSDYIGFTTRGGVPTLDGAFIEHADPAPQLAFPRSAGFLGEDRYTAPISDPPPAIGTPDGIPDGGAPVERWSKAEVRHVDGVTSFLFNGVLIRTIEFSDFGNDTGPDGMPWFGYEDFFGSVAGNDSPKVALGPVAPAGDYNDDGAVNAADYTVWRDSLGATVASGAGADGNSNGVIDQADYDTWVSTYGQVATAGTTFDPFNASYVIIDNVVVSRIASVGAIPEPSAAVLALLAAAGMVRRKR